MEHVNTPIISTDAFWALVALTIFLIIMCILKVPSIVASKLDERSQNIANELEDARNYKEEALRLLKSCREQKLQAEEQAKQLLEKAQREARQISNDIITANEEYIARQKEIAEEKIKLAETEAIKEIKARAAELAVSASKDILYKYLTTDNHNKIIEKSINDIKEVSI